MNKVTTNTIRFLGILKKELTLLFTTGSLLLMAKPVYAVATAIGDVDPTPEGLANKVIIAGVSISGGVALLLLGYGSFVLMTSSGNPDKIQEGREIVFNALAGLVLVVSAAALLNVIGVKILKLQDFDNYVKVIFR